MTIQPRLSSTYQAIYAAVRQIPAGKVATYGQIAAIAGLPNQARLVGYALFRVDLASDIPWQRVINAKGEISQSAFRDGGDDLQRVLLEAEGIQFDPKGKISLHRYAWVPSET
jgi:methylated-DNA-protein-cysteine methyltransferase related protein